MTPHIRPPRPRWRDLDENPARSDDVHIRLPFNWGSYEGSGRLLVMLLISASLLLASIASLSYAVWHDIKTQKDHQMLIRVLEVQTCVLTLDGEERKEYREQGRYCPTPRQLESERVR